MTTTDEPTLNEALGITPAALTGLDQPLWLQNSAYPAALDRALIETTIGAGVSASGDFAVTQRAAGANMSVDVAAGRAAVSMTDAPNQGRALCRATAVNNLVVGGAPAAGLTRIDRVVARVYDASLIGGSINGWQLEVVPGTPASSASPPSVPASSLPLARITVPSGLASITNAAITDDRTMMASALPSTVARFATAAARTIALPGPTLNQLSMLDNRPGVVQYWSGSAWTDLTPLLQSGGYSGTTDGSGNVPTFTFPTAFGATPNVFFQSYMNSGHVIIMAFVQPTYFQAKVFAPGGAAAAGFAFSFLWFAVGNRVAAT